MITRQMPTKAGNGADNTNRIFYQIKNGKRTKTSEPELNY